MIGYHGTSYEAWEGIRRSSYNLSYGDEHWVGDGVYFFINGIYSDSPSSDAESWAVLQAYNPKTKNNDYTEYAILKSNISDDIKIWDLSSEEGASLFRMVKNHIYNKISGLNKKIKNHPADGLLINFAFTEPGMKDNFKDSFNAVKNDIYIKLTRNERYRNIRWLQPNCTIIAVRDRNLIIETELEKRGDIQ